MVPGGGNGCLLAIMFLLFARPAATIGHCCLMMGEVEQTEIPLKEITHADNHQQADLVFFRRYNNACRVFYFSEIQCIAMIVEDLLLLLFRVLDRVLPWFVEYRLVFLVIGTLLVFTAFFFVWIRIYLRIKNKYRYNAKVKEAETVLAAAKQKAAGQIKKVQALKEKLGNEFEEKETALQQELKEKIKEYLVRIKKLEKEKLELKALNGDLMNKLKTV